MAGVSFHRLADDEVNDAARYYDLESPGLGLAFLDEVERCVAAILDHPEAATPIRGHIRRRMMGRFPYALL